MYSVSTAVLVIIVVATTLDCRSHNDVALQTMYICLCVFERKCIELMGNNERVLRLAKLLQNDVLVLGAQASIHPQALITV